MSDEVAKLSDYMLAIEYERMENLKNQLTEDAGKCGERLKVLGTEIVNRAKKKIEECKK